MLRTRILACLLPAAATFVSVSPAMAASRPYNLETDFPKIVNVSEAQLAPGGTRVAYVVERADMTKDEYVSSLAIVNVASGEVRVLTPSRDDVDAPRWSHDGAHLAFVAPESDDSKAKPQVWILPMDGGEATLLTHAPNGVTSYAWRPDGKAIAYQTSDDAPNKAEIEKNRDLFVVGDQDYLSQRAPVPSHLWVQPLDGNARRITSGNWSSVSGMLSAPMSWSSDGTRIGFTRIPDAYMGHAGETRASIVDVATGKIADVGAASAATMNPTFSHAGNRLAYSVARDGLWAFQWNAQVKNLDSDSDSRVASHVDRNFMSLAWAFDGSLYLRAHDRVVNGIWRVHPDGEVTRVDLGDVIPDTSPVFAKDGSFTFVGSTVGDPSEVYIVAPGSRPRRLTNYNFEVCALTLHRVT